MMFLESANSELTKIASARAKVRAIESAIGAGTGAVAGGIGGYGSYAPSKPKEWRDQQGRVHSRALTGRERDQRQRRASKAFLAGMAAGAAAGPSLSLLRRAMQAGAEGHQAAKVLDQYLAPLRREVQKLDEAAADPKNRRPIDWFRGGPTKAERRAQRGHAYVKSEEDRLQGLRTQARKNRDERLFGGATWNRREPVPGSKWKRRDTGQPVDHTLSHRGLVHASYPQPADMRTLAKFYKKELAKAIRNPRPEPKS